MELECKLRNHSQTHGVHLDTTMEEDLTTIIRDNHKKTSVYREKSIAMIALWCRITESWLTLSCLKHNSIIIYSPYLLKDLVKL